MQSGALPKGPAPRAFAARKLVELANALEPVQDGRIYIEKINGPLLLHESGTYVRFTLLASRRNILRAIEKGWLERSSSRAHGRNTRPAFLGLPGRLDRRNHGA
jgi:hypothetical protein